MPKKRNSSPKAAPKQTDAEIANAAASNPAKRIIPLADGTWCYLVDPLNGRYTHLKVDSASFDERLAEQRAISAAYEQRLRRELAALAHGDFPAALARYDRAAAGTTVQAA